jgi:hydrogenase nickel incorporation protein HypA/HybF
MHEFGFCEGILEAVQRRAAGRRVKRVAVRAGVLHRLGRDAMQQGFALVAIGSEAEGAILELSFVPARWCCRLCQKEAETDDTTIVCSSCGGIEIDIRGGEEMILESIEYEPVAESESDGENKDRLPR